ncbi:serine/threonine-protein kinase Nek4 isoform X3 [Ictalurus furcatus]|uniref:serine/threonine-protein kinase Nek4 isoform X3 n=1 Tax=Ictalurus furcatus TaxID=66913 RepID=UPI002350265A|nr:serine/threonine-protein kinase Nek4 isoform X3 [Ictalurus furcatus]
MLTWPRCLVTKKPGLTISCSIAATKKKKKKSNQKFEFGYYQQKYLLVHQVKISRLIRHVKLRLENLPRIMESYVFIRVVGKGSYGEVNLVQHKSERKQYVIKKLNLRTSSKRERRAAEQEAQLLSQLKHPNIVTYRESWEGEDYQLYIVMGFCEGGDLYHRLKQQKGELLPERQVVEWFVQIAMALQYLHEKHILHRDLKTQNIFLTKTNIIKVGDLGIARVLENQNDMASTLIGTPYYMSPELFSNKPYNYKLPQMPSKYDPLLGELIKRMLCKRPDDRPDVKHILRQPYIKQQIAAFLEATKEKTARSRKRVNSRPNRDTPREVPVLQNQEPHCVNSEQKSRGKRSEENQSKHHNGIKDNILPNPPLLINSPSQDIQEVLNSTDQNVATISNIDIDIQPQEHRDKLRKVKPHRKGNLIGKEERSLVSQSSSGTEPPKPTERIEPVKDSRAPFGEEDTMKLLQQAAMEDIKTGKRDTTEAKEDQKTEAEHPLRERGTSLESTDKLLEPFIPVALMESHKPEQTAAPSETSKHHIRPPFSSAEPSVSRQRRQNKGDVAHDESKIKAANSRPLPPLLENSPTVGIKRREGSEVEMAKHSTHSQPDHQHDPTPQNRLLSARERRRLKKSRENQSDSGAPAVRRASCDVASLNAKHTDQPDCPRPASVPAVTHKNRLLSARERRRLRLSRENQGESAAPAVRRASCDVASLNGKHTDQPERKSSRRHSDEEECSSSTSTTERSEGDYRESKSETTEMQDLVQMMTQTLRMDARDVLCEQESSRSNSAMLPEFKLNRTYRDTLMIHGKSREGERDFHLSDFRSDDSSGPAKIRRAVEHLRTDVVKGLGVKLLDKVLDILQEEDEDKREVLLRQQMGEEKYRTYAVMVRQLKFFEDVAFKC